MSDKKSNKETSAKMFTNPLYKPKAKGKKSEDGKYGRKYMLQRMKSFADKQPRLSGARTFSAQPPSNLNPKLPVVQRETPMSDARRQSLKRQVSDEKWEEWYKEWQKNPKMPPPPRGTPEDHGFSLEGVVNKPVTTNNPMFGKNLPKRKTGTMAKAKETLLSAETLRKNRSIFRKKKAGKGKRRRTRKKRKRRRTKKKRKRRRKKRRRTRK